MLERRRIDRSGVLTVTVVVGGYRALPESLAMGCSQYSDAVNIAWQPTIAGPAQASRHQHRIREHALLEFPLLSGGQRVYNSYVHA
jgi:hypothetical protein